MSMIVCKTFFVFVNSPITKIDHVLEELKAFLTKLKSLSIPHLDLSEKIGKVVIKSDKI